MFLLHRFMLKIEIDNFVFAIKAARRGILTVGHLILYKKLGREQNFGKSGARKSGHRDKHQGVKKPILLSEFH